MMIKTTTSSLSCGILIMVAVMFLTLFTTASAQGTSSLNRFLSNIKFSHFPLRNGRTIDLALRAASGGSFGTVVREIQFIKGSSAPVCDPVGLIYTYRQSSRRRRRFTTAFLNGILKRIIRPQNVQQVINRHRAQVKVLDGNRARFTIPYTLRYQNTRDFLGTACRQANS